MFSPRKEDLKDLAFWTYVQCYKSVKNRSNCQPNALLRAKKIILGPKISKATQREDAVDKKKLTKLVLPGYEQKPLAVLLLLFVRRRHFIQSAF
jgi:hypothetical protein